MVSPSVRRRVAIPRFEGRRLLGCLTLAVAAAWLHTTWFPGRHFVDRELMFAGLSMIDWTQLFSPPPASLAAPAPPGGKVGTAQPKAGETASAFRSDSSASGVPAAGTVAAADRQARAQARLTRLTTAQGVWLFSMTFVACWLAMTGAAGIAAWLVQPGQVRYLRLLALVMLAVVALITWYYWPAPGEQAGLPASVQYTYAGAFALLAAALCAGSSRRAAVGWLTVAVLGLGVCIVLAWRARGWGWPVFATQAVWFSLMVIAALLGAALCTKVRRLTTAAVAFVFLSCLVTAAGMWYGVRQGAFVEFTPTIFTYAKVMAAQSLIAWVLLGVRWAEVRSSA
ncbi:MAG: hypothetical protein GY842_21925 [bacterium]|nr:hypothetical protein [bacterium]